MKNKSFVKYFLIKISLYFLLMSNVFAEEINFMANEISTLNEGNIIIGEKNVEAKIDGEIEIYADKITYDKKREILFAEGNVVAIDLINQIEIRNNKIDYYKKQNQIITIGETFIDIQKKYKMKSKDIFFSLNEKKIESNYLTSVIDNLNNEIISSSFEYDHKLDLLRGTNIEVSDNDQNKYFLKNGMVKLREFVLLGKDIKVILRNDLFGNKENEPKIKGNSVNYKNDKTTITKGIFTSCKNSNNCPSWSITSKKIIHDKKKKEIHYKDAWLRIYNAPVLYFPKFFHPDPSVKRKSGFLIPTFGESKKLGSSIKLPYFYAASKSSDFTFKPRFFSNSEFLLQTEYRKNFENAKHILDFSINKKDNDDDGRQTHFFSNSNFDLENQIFDQSNLELKIEKTSNDNFISLYSLESTSPIISDTSVLENKIEFIGETDDLFFELSLESYETLNKKNSDRYEFVYPNYSLTKSINRQNSLVNNIQFTSSGNQKTFSTNIYEAVQINNILLSSLNNISNLGYNNNFKTLIKNVNTDGKNSSKFKDNTQSEILTLFAYDIDFPLIKEFKNTKNFLTPKISLRYSPNDTKSLINETRLLNTDNIFSLNRIGFDETVEGGASLTVGLDFDKKRKDTNDTFFSSKIATVFREQENENLPITSTLNKKQSDFVGEIILNPLKNFQFSYNYLIDSHLNKVNLHSFENKFIVNNFVNTFTFYEENNLIGNNSYYENKSTINLNNNSSISFKTRENKKENLTEYYNLIYEYKNDCLVASLRYNKDYYSNNGLGPSEELFFNITLIPLGSTQTSSFLD